MANSGRTWFKKGSTPWNKGMFGYSMPPASEERKRKIGNANRGRKFTGEKLANIARAVAKNALGTKRSVEQKVAISLRFKGKPRFDLRGEKNHLWKGGITPVNKAIRNSLKYKLWREAVFKRDNYACIWCGTKNGNGKTIKLNADHIKPFAYFPELRFAIDNGRTLCRECHRKTDTFGSKVVKLYGRL